MHADPGQLQPTNQFPSRCLKSLLVIRSSKPVQSTPGQSLRLNMRISVTPKRMLHMVHASSESNQVTSSSRLGTLSLPKSVPKNKWLRSISQHQVLLQSNRAVTLQHWPSELPAIGRPLCKTNALLIPVIRLKVLLLLRPGIFLSTCLTLVFILLSTTIPIIPPRYPPGPRVHSRQSPNHLQSD